MNIVWLYLDKKAATINALKDYDSMAYITRNTDKDVARIHMSMESPAGPVLNGLPSAHDPQAGESRLANCLDDIDCRMERYRQALEYMEWFRPAWDALSDEERYLLRAFFVGTGAKGDALQDVCDTLHVERAQAYRKKDKALSHLTLLLYGKSA